MNSKILLTGLVLTSCSATALWGQVPVQFNTVPSRTIGQAKLQLVSTGPNLVDGRGVNAPIGVAVDNSVSPPVLYVADTNNNRVLIWKNARASNGTAADLVIGQNDFFATPAGGPGTSSSVGLRAPSGMAVDSRGNLYVIDSGNNRILRYARPYSQPADQIQPNLVIGQRSFSANLPNMGERSPAARSVSFFSGNDLLTAYLTFDSAGNLWVTDSGNSRVLRFPASVLGDSAANGPEANLVIGQPDFSAAQTIDWGKQESRLLKSALLQPSGLAFDSTGRLYVTDTANRMLVYTGTLRNGMDASRIAGLVVNVQGQQPRPPINEYTLFRPESVFVSGSSVFVVDSGVHRILRYDAFETWPEETVLLPSPPAKAVFGQPDLLSFRANRGGRDPNETSFQTPTGVAVAGSELFIADSGNNRILSIPINGTSLGAATRVLGQAGFNYRGVNLVEGRELFLANGSVSLPLGGGSAIIGGGVVIDRGSNPPRLYIADTYNNRIMAYADARRVKPGDTADLIIGQANLMETKANSPTSDTDLVTDTGLLTPTGVAVDSKGDLYVADSGNGRVLRFAKPFEQGQKFNQRANLVLGQSGYNIKITDATARNMSNPYGLAFTVEGHLLVSDIAHNRVLLFRRPLTGDFTNGQAAVTVFGQRDFLTSQPGAEESRFNSPMHIATDTDDRLYVCDPGNRRVAIFDRVLSATNNPAPAIVLNLVSSQNDRLGTVQGINVSPRTGEIWVADTSNNRVVRYPQFNSLILLPAPNLTIGSLFPQAVAIDAFDNLVIAEGTNRVAFFYPGLAATSAAHYLRRRISPGMVAALYPLGIRFGEETAVFSALPLPKELADTELLVNEVPAPLYFVSPTQINFYVPMGTPTGGQADFIVQKKSTGQILASGVFDIGVATPSFFTTTQNGQGQIAALNEDNSVNTAANAIDRGKVIQLFATGQGFVENAPPDGSAPTGVVPTPEPLPTVVIGSTPVDPRTEILYTGLAPGLVGVWQINVRVPMRVPPGTATDVVIQYRSIPSNQPEGGGGVIRTTIAVK